MIPKKLGKTVVIQGKEKKKLKKVKNSKKKPLSKGKNRGIV